MWGSNSNWDGGCDCCRSVLLEVLFQEQIKKYDSLMNSKSCCLFYLYISEYQVIQLLTIERGGDLCDGPMVYSIVLLCTCFLIFFSCI